MRYAAPIRSCAEGEENAVYWMAPTIADAETGFGGASMPMSDAGEPALAPQQNE
jgi:isocitrate lyase